MKDIPLTDEQMKLWVGDAKIPDGYEPVPVLRRVRPGETFVCECGDVRTWGSFGFVCDSCNLALPLRKVGPRKEAAK